MSMTIEQFDKKWYPWLAGAAIIARDNSLPTRMQPGVEQLEELCKDWRATLSSARWEDVPAGDMQLIIEELTRNERDMIQYPHDHPLRLRARRALALVKEINGD